MSCLRSRWGFLQVVVVVIALLGIVGCAAQAPSAPAPTAASSAAKPAATAAPAGAPAAAPTAAPAASQPATLSVLYEYSTDSQKKGTEDLFADFQKSHPEITLNLQPVTQAKAPDVLQTRLAGNDPPDVLLTVPARVPNLIRDSMLLDLSSYIPAGYKEAFGPNGLVAESSGDKTFGFPLSKGIRSIAYNVDLFDKASVKAPQKPEEMWTWDQMVAAAKKVKEATGIRYGLQFEKPSFDGWLPFLFQNGGMLVSSDGKTVMINKPEGVAAIQWTVDLHKSGLAAPGILEGVEDPLRLFASGQVAMWLGTGSYSVPPLEAQVKTFKYGFTFLPKQVKPATVTFGNDVVAFKSTKYPKAAWDLINYATTADDITRISNAMGNFPARLDAKNIQFPRQDLVPFFTEQGKFADADMSKQMLIPFYSASRDRLLRELQAATSGQKSAQAAADAMAAIIQGELAK